MSLSVVAAAVLMGQSIFSTASEPPAHDVIDVAYADLAAGRGQEAVRKLEANGAARSDDPATLINLGAAYAQAGRTGQALSAYRAAIATPVRYDLQLADGSWVDSRFAARRALRNMMASTTVASR